MLRVRGEAGPARLDRRRGNEALSRRLKTRKRERPGENRIHLLKGSMREDVVGGKSLDSLDGTGSTRKYYHFVLEAAGGATQEKGLI